MTEFFKVSGSGNDFVALVEPPETPSSEHIKAWCRRGVSLGADGLFVLRRTGADAVEMKYFNADGDSADLCLNGTRCAAQLAFHLGWAGKALRVHTPAGSFAARRLDDSRVAVELPAPPEGPREVTLDVGGRPYAGWRVVVGVPHLVLVWDESLDGAPVVELGRRLRHHPNLQPAGSNVNFVRFSGRQSLEIRTYERGVEDETLSCGTGVLAAAAVGLASGRSTLPLAATTRGGFELVVEGDRASGRWSLAGDARLVARGRLLPGAAAG